MAHDLEFLVQGLCGHALNENDDGQKKWTKNMVLIANLGYLASMGLMGFWHGFTWYYILYGFYHAFLLIGYDAWLRFKKKNVKLKFLTTAGRGASVSLSPFNSSLLDS